MKFVLIGLCTKSNQIENDNDNSSGSDCEIVPNDAKQVSGISNLKNKYIMETSENHEIKKAKNLTHQPRKNGTEE